MNPTTRWADLTKIQRAALLLVGEYADEAGYVADIDLITWGPTQVFPGGVLMNARTAWSLHERGLVMVLGSRPAWVEQITEAGLAALEASAASPEQAGG